MKYAKANTVSIGGISMKVVVVKSPRVIAPVLRLIFRIKKEHRE